MTLARSLLLMLDQRAVDAALHRLTHWLREDAADPSGDALARTQASAIVTAMEVHSADHDRPYTVDILMRVTARVVDHETVAALLSRTPVADALRSFLAEAMVTFETGYRLRRLACVVNHSPLRTSLNPGESLMPNFRFLTTGESHGPGLTIVIEGIPAGVAITEEYIRGDLARRQGGYGRGGRQQIETDWARMRSGVRHGLTMGSPITLLVDNKDWENWHEVMSPAPIERELNTVTRLRPGHADTTGSVKYNHSDVRPTLERSSARETASRVAVGAVCRRFLEYFGIEIRSHVVNIGGVVATLPEHLDWDALEDSPVRTFDKAAEAKMIEAIEAAKTDGDTLGGIMEVIATGAPIGLGSHIQWDTKLNARIAQALMSINAVKDVSFGRGAEVANLRGSQVHDVIKPVDEWTDEGRPDRWVRPWQRRTNNAGGFEGGMTTGEPIICQFTIKPIATLHNPLPSVDLITGEVVNAHYERSDVCVVPAAGVIGESMVAVCLVEAMLDKFGGDHIEETLRNYRSYMATTGPRGREWPEPTARFIE